MGLLGDFEVTKAGIAIIGLGLFVLIPVVAIMTEHQRKMARILRGQQETENSDSGQVIIGVHANVVKKSDQLAALTDEIRALRSELTDLRYQVATMSGSSLLPAIPAEPIRDRLSQNA